MSEYLCIDIITIVLIVISNVLVTILNVGLIIIKNWVITREFKDSIKMIKELRDKAWEPEPLSC